MAPPFIDALDGLLSGQGWERDQALVEEVDQAAGEEPTLAAGAVMSLTPGAAPPDLERGGTGLRATGPYVVHGAWRNGDVTVLVEQNTDQAGVHDPVAVIAGNGYRSAVDPTDHDLLAAEVAAAAGDFSLHEARAARAALAAAGFTEDRSAGEWVRNGLRVTGLLLATLPALLVGRLLGLVWLLPPTVVTNATKKALLDAWYSGSAVGAPATHHFGLSTTTPAEDGTNVTEPSGGAAYARVAKTANTTEFPASTAADPTVKTNGTTITWPAATGSWGTVTHVTQHDAASAGNVKDFQPLGASQAISTGTTASIAASAWQSTLT
jgi:hypothetical protein